jgi:hypothetical protein
MPARADIRSEVMRLLALIDSADHVCYRYRLRAFEPALRNAGIAVEAVALPKSRGEWATALTQAAEVDAVLLQRRLLSPWSLWRLRRAARRLIYDLDDAVFYRDSNAWKPARSWSRRLRFRATVARADLVLAGNRFLVETATACRSRANVIFAPTCVSCSGKPAAHATNTARLVWIGSRSTLPSLFDAEPCLTAAQMRVPIAELRVVCDVFPTLDVVRVVPRVWSEVTEAVELAEADIGVSWLPEHPWSRGKCGLKVLQYMAAGLPVIANPLGVHNELIEHGRTGYLARTPLEWAAAVERLSASPELRREMGARGRRFVEQNYSVAAQTPQLIAALQSLMPRAPSRSRAA